MSFGANTSPILYLLYSCMVAHLTLWDEADLLSPSALLTATIFSSSPMTLQLGLLPTLPLMPPQERALSKSTGTLTWNKYGVTGGLGEFKKTKVKEMLILCSTWAWTISCSWALDACHVSQHWGNTAQNNLPCFLRSKEHCTKWLHWVLLTHAQSSDSCIQLLIWFKLVIWLKCSLIPESSLHHALDHTPTWDNRQQLCTVGA